MGSVSGPLLLAVPLEDVEQVHAGNQLSLLLQAGPDVVVDRR